jgi:hypothetical protein
MTESWARYGSAVRLIVLDGDPLTDIELLASDGRKLDRRRGLRLPRRSR